MDSSESLMNSEILSKAIIRQMDEKMDFVFGLMETPTK